MQKSILIDATHLEIAQSTGVEVYCQGLLPALSEDLIEHGWKVGWIGHQAEPPLSKPSQVTWLFSPSQAFWSQTGLLKLLNSYKPDYYFTPSGIPPLRYAGATIVTVHDMAAYTFPEAFSWKQQLRLRWLLGRAAAKAHLILTPSEYSKQQIEHFWHISPEKIQVTALGLLPKSSPSQPMASLSASQPFFLYIGRIERKKNLLTIIKAFALMNVAEVNLVLAGKEGLGSQEIYTHIGQLPKTLQQRIKLLGYVTDAEKQWLYEQAFACLVPGVAEGFGLPLLESLFHQKPVIAAHSGSLPELGKNAVLYAEATSAQDWCKQMRYLLQDRNTYTRLQQEGKEIASYYNWEKTAQKTAQAFLKS